MSVLQPTHRRSLKRAYFEALAFARVDRLLQRLNARRGLISVLNLHRVTPGYSPYWPAITPAAFRALIDYVARNCRLLELDEIGNLAPAGVSSVALSFDDGCRDFLEYAMPILQERRLRVNHNVIVESVESGRPPWMIQVVDALNAATDERVRSLVVPGFQGRLENDDEASKARFGAQLTGYLKQLSPGDRAEVAPGVDALIAETDSNRLTPMMSRAEVQEMADHHDLGCHSYAHEALGLLSNEEFELDLRECMSFFDDIRWPMRIFAFPYGSHRLDQIETLRAFGVEHILLVGEQPAKPSNGVYERITMYGETNAELRLRAMGHSVSGLGIGG